MIHVIPHRDPGSFGVRVTPSRERVSRDWFRVHVEPVRCGLDDSARWTFEYWVIVGPFIWHGDFGRRWGR